jgi:hypothetical protein
MAQGGEVNSFVIGLIGISSVIAGYLIGKRKDRKILGGVLGFLLGPIGVLVILFLPETAKRRAVRARVKASNEEWRKRWGENGSATKPAGPAASTHPPPTS